MMALMRWWRSRSESTRELVEAPLGMVLLVGGTALVLYLGALLLAQVSYPYRWGILGLGFGFLVGRAWPYR